MFSILDIIMRIIGYVLVITGLWLLVGQPFLIAEIKRLSRSLKRKRTIKLTQKEQKTEKKNSMFQEHIHYMMLSLGKSSKSVGNFYFLSFTIFITSFMIIFLNLESILLSMIIATAFMIIPYVVVRFRLAKKRLTTSHDFMNDFHLFLQNYQITGKDIYFTILNMSKDSHHTSMKRVYMRLLSALQKERNEKEFKEAMNIFAYTINTSFATRLGKLILKAHVDGVDISVGLQDLNVDMKKRKIDMVNEKTSNLESVITGYLPLVIMPLMLFIGYRIAGVVNFETLFFQPLPFTIFVVGLIMTIFCVMLSYVFSKPKADI